MWNQKSTFELGGKTVGVVGLGEIRKDVVRKLSSFEVKILAYDVERDEEFASKYHLKLITT
jgi:D-3-phosphoglycerate dehydrogenase